MIWSTTQTGSTSSSIAVTLKPPSSRRALRRQQDVLARVAALGVRPGRDFYWPETSAARLTGCLCGAGHGASFAGCVGRWWLIDFGVGVGYQRS